MPIWLLSALRYARVRDCRGDKGFPIYNILQTWIDTVRGKVYALLLIFILILNTVYTDTKYC
jgi:hypothetical protein